MDAKEKSEQYPAPQFDRDAYRRDFEILELSTDASLEEIEDAYSRLKTAYSPDAIVISSPVKDEIEKQRRREIIGKLDGAYRNLTKIFRQEKRQAEAPAAEPAAPAPADAPACAPAADIATGAGQAAAVQADAGEAGAGEADTVQTGAVQTDAVQAGAGEAEAAPAEPEKEETAAPDEDIISETVISDDGQEMRVTHKANEKPSLSFSLFSGKTLKQIREEMNVSLEDISYETKIRIHALKNLEEENFPDLPPEVYIKGFVKSYALFLSLDPMSTMRNYMDKYEAWKGEKRQRQRGRGGKSWFSFGGGRKREERL